MARRIVLTSYGWRDAGGGTAVPRVVAHELAARGWEVTVFHAATRGLRGREPYAISEDRDGPVRLVGVHNRPTGIWDHERPDRELDDPPVTAAFADLLDDVRPDVVHFHNLHNLGAALIDEAASRGLPTYFSTHNHWLVCSRAYLLDHTGRVCAGPGDPERCAACAGGGVTPAELYAARLDGLRRRVGRGVDRVLAVSAAVRSALVNAGYDPEQIDVVRQAVPSAERVWEALGRDRAPGRRHPDGPLVVGFFGSALAYKGPQLLVEAVQDLPFDVRVEVHGESVARVEEHLRHVDRRGCVELRGAYDPGELPARLAGVDVVAMPSMVYDCAPLTASECLAGRVPVVAPRLSGLAEAVRHDVDGLVFDALSAEDLRRQLARLVTERGLLERLQRGIEAPRPVAAYLDELEALYDRRHVAEVPPALPLSVAWQGDHGRPTSLSTINDEVCARLHGRDGVRVERRDAGGTAIDPPLQHIADVEVRHQWPPDLRPARAGRLVLIQPWEFGPVPAEWVEPMRERVEEVWVPSEACAEGYRASGIERVVVVPNGVDLDGCTPDGPRAELPHEGTRRFLFVGGAIGRKGIDVLLRAWTDAFPAGDEPVSLVIKDSPFYARQAERGPIEALAAVDPRVVHLTDDLSRDGLAALYRACDVLVHPYRGEGFAMPVLEAMACGLPAIHTAGGPTEEFCPPSAGWTIPSVRVDLAEDVVGGMPTAGRPFLLEPDRAALAALLREAADAPLAGRAAAAREAAQRLSWDAVTAMYAERLRAVAARPVRRAEAPPGELPDAGAPVLLATPAWRGHDALGELLAAWQATTAPGHPGTLVLLADPAVDGDPAALERRVLAAADAAGADLEATGDIVLHLMPDHGDRDAALHAAVDGYAPLHRACGHHERAARRAGVPLVAPDAAAVRAWLTAAARAPASA